MKSSPNPQANPEPAAKRTLSFVGSVGLLLGALLMQWSSMTHDLESQRQDNLFAPQSSCSDAYPPPWRTQRTGQSGELIPSIRAFGLPACESIEFRPSKCSDSQFLVRCYSETERKGLWHVYRVDLESDEIFSVTPDQT